jgi:PX domain
VVFYLVLVRSGTRKWQLQKRFNDFYDLDREMRAKHSNMPVIPPKTYFPLKYDKDIEDRREKLHLYLQEMMNRVDMRTSAVFRKFIEIDEQIPESVMFQAKKLSAITDLSLGGRDFELALDRSLLFVAMSEMNIT